MYVINVYAGDRIYRRSASVRKRHVMVMLISILLCIVIRCYYPKELLTYSKNTKVADQWATVI